MYEGLEGRLETAKEIIWMATVMFGFFFLYSALGFLLRLRFVDNLSKVDIESWIQICKCILCLILFIHFFVDKFYHFENNVVKIFIINVGLFKFKFSTCTISEII